MRTLLLSVLIMAASLPVTEGGPSADAGRFVESSRRQDFTGEGTYHRIGLLREQRRVVEGVATASASEAEPRRNLWQSFTRLFVRKTLR